MVIQYNTKKELAYLDTMIVRFEPIYRIGSIKPKLTKLGKLDRRWRRFSKPLVAFEL
jgi:hypothetical protein